MPHLDTESHPHVNYLGVFIALCVCTALSVAFDLIEMTPILVVVAVLAVAVAKAMFVMTYFMHLKFEGRWKFLILMPTAILAVGLMVALAPDMAMHYYTYDTPQGRLVVYDHESGHGEAGHDEEEGHDHEGGEEDHHAEDQSEGH